MHEGHRRAAARRARAAPRRRPAARRAAAGAPGGTSARGRPAARRGPLSRPGCRSRRTRRPARRAALAGTRRSGARRRRTALRSVATGPGRRRWRTRSGVSSRTTGSGTSSGSSDATRGSRRVSCRRRGSTAGNRGTRSTQTSSATVLTESPALVRRAALLGSCAEPVAEQRAGVRHERHLGVGEPVQEPFDAQPRAVGDLLRLRRDRAVPGREVAERVVAGVVVGVVGLAERDELAGDPQLLGELAPSALERVLAVEHDPARGEVPVGGVDVLDRRTPVDVDASVGIAYEDAGRGVPQVVGAHQRTRGAPIGTSPVVVERDDLLVHGSIQP